jgi:hypothetical protein
MTHVRHTAPHGTASGSAARRAAPGSARQRRIRLISEAVVASYIHDISARTAVGWPGTLAARSAMRSGHVGVRDR